MPLAKEPTIALEWEAKGQEEIEDMRTTNYYTEEAYRFHGGYDDETTTYATVKKAF